MVLFLALFLLNSTVNHGLKYYVYDDGFKACVSSPNLSCELWSLKTNCLHAISLWISNGPFPLYLPTNYLLTFPFTQKTYPVLLISVNGNFIFTDAQTKKLGITPNSSFFQSPHTIHQNILSTLVLKYIWIPTTFLHLHSHPPCLIHHHLSPGLLSSSHGGYPCFLLLPRFTVFTTAASDSIRIPPHSPHPSATSHFNQSKNWCFSNGP